MNVKPGGKQRVMHDTMWQGCVQKMIFRDGRPKGMRQILQERGYNTQNMVALLKHPDFRDEKSLIEQLIMKSGHIPILLPKFHPEINPIERVWAQLKRYTKGHCKYSIPSLRKNIPLAYDSVTLENIQNHFRKVRHYMFAYLEGLIPGNKEVQNCNKITQKNRIK